MNTKIFLLAFSAFILTSASQKTSSAKKYLVDVEKSKVKWTGYYVFSFGSHYGTIDLANGALFTSENGSIKGFFEIDMHSIQTLDMKPNEGGSDLTDHLKSDDFFSVSQYPAAKFEILKSEQIKDAAPENPNYEISGELTIKGTTLPVSFPATITVGDKSITAVAKFKFDRTKWNIRYNSGRFFDNIGDGAISDGIGVEIELNAHN